MRRLFLWDIDGTLLRSGGVSRDALFAALAQVRGRPVADTGMVFDGMTQPAIVRALLVADGVSEDELPGVMRRTLRAFGPALQDRKAELIRRGFVLPGVHRALAAAVERPEFTINTVLTGNLAVNAVLKLDAFKLTGYFDLEVGAYGSDAEDRLDLVDVVLDRLERRSLPTFQDDEIWLIGDAPGDLATARANDVRCLLVATGSFDAAALRALDPDACLTDLADTGAFLRAVEL